MRPEFIKAVAKLYIIISGLKGSYATKTATRDTPNRISDLARILPLEEPLNDIMEQSEIQRRTSAMRPKMQSQNTV